MASNKNKKVNTKYIQDVADSYKKSMNSADTVDIITFAEAQWGLNLKLFPVQKFILKSFYGIVLDDEEKSISIPDEMNTREIGRFTEKEFMDFLINTGRTNIKEYRPGKQCRELILCCGRRSSKSSIASIISNYETYRLIKMGNPQAYFGFPDGHEIAVTTASTSNENATTLFGMMKARCMNCNYLKDRVVNKTQTYFNLKTYEDELKSNEPSLLMLCSGAGSDTLRGHNNIVVIFDEAAFFALNGMNSGEEVYRALTPSVSSFTKGGDRTKGEGRIILLSSPYGKSGLFYQKYLESFDNTESVLMFQMYSAMVNPTIDNSILRDAKRKDPAMFDCEYGGKFSDTVSTWMDFEALNKVIDKEKTKNPKQGKPGVEYFMGLDYGGKTDGSSVAIVHKEEEKIILDYADVYYSGSSDVMFENHNVMYNNVNKMFSGFEIIPVEGFAGEIKKLNDMFPTRYGWFDQFNGYALLEMLKSKGLSQFEAKNVSAGLNTQVYQICKTLINSGLIEIFNHEILTQELVFLEEIKSGSHVSVEAPQRTGFHDDISDAFVRAIYACYEKTGGRLGSAKVSNFSKNRLRNGTYHSYHKYKMKIHGTNFKTGRFL